MNKKGGEMCVYVNVVAFSSEYLGRSVADIERELKSVGFVWKEIRSENFKNPLGKKWIFRGLVPKNKVYELKNLKCVEHVLPTSPEHEEE